MTTKLEIIAFGVIVTAWGIYCYSGKSAARAHRIVGPFVYLVYGLIPYGVATILGGLAFIIGHGSFDGPLVIAAFALMVFGIILWFWHPYWIRPKWLRNSWGD